MSFFEFCAESWTSALKKEGWLVHPKRFQSEDAAAELEIMAKKSRGQEDEIQQYWKPCICNITSTKFDA